MRRLGLVFLLSVAILIPHKAEASHITPGACPEFGTIHEEWINNPSNFTTVFNDLCPVMYNMDFLPYMFHYYWIVGYGNPTVEQVVEWTDAYFSGKGC